MSDLITDQVMFVCLIVICAATWHTGRGLKPPLKFYQYGASVGAAIAAAALISRHIL